MEDNDEHSQGRRLYVIDKVRHGLEVADTQGTITQEEAEEQLSKWITE